VNLTPEHALKCLTGDDKKRWKKVKLSLCLTKHHAMKTYWGSGGIAPRITDLGTRWRWVVNFTPRPLYPQGKAPGTHWIGGWVGLRAVLDTVLKRKIPSPRRGSKLRTPIVQSVAKRYTDRAITAPAMIWNRINRAPKTRWKKKFIPLFVYNYFVRIFEL
jgi:hypothetical protein